MTDAEIREYLKTHTYYQYETHEALQLICSKISQRDDTKEVQLTDEFDSPSLTDGTIAYHRVFGVVTANSYWYFSSKQMEQDIVAAENNPQISAHLLHINSPGGEAWYMDRLSETLRNAKTDSRHLRGILRICGLLYWLPWSEALRYDQQRLRWMHWNHVFILGLRTILREAGIKEDCGQGYEIIYEE